MFCLMMLLAGPGGLLAASPGFQDSFLQIIFPEKIKANTSDNSELENAQVSYIIPIEDKLYTVHLQQRLFLADDFMVYLYDQGSVSSHPSNIQTHCYYQGYVEGYPNSLVTLSTCSGLRGILQFENVSYGIEPLELAVEFQHLLYKFENENKEFSIFTENSRSLETEPVEIFISEKTDNSSVLDVYPLYLEMYIVVDKTLYDYLGSDNILVTNKIVEIIGFVNSIFSQLKVTIVLSSLEFWSDKNQISTAGEAGDLLRGFLEWKQSYLTLRPHDIAYLFIYRDSPDYVGSVFPGRMCDSQYSSGVALYPKKTTLEAFSVIVAQLVGLSLGLSYDDPKNCRCSGAICIMNPEALQSNGVKTFSNCSLNDFENLISNVGTRCLQNKPQMLVRSSVCGNGILEKNEVCDCGSEVECTNTCCDAKTCTPKHGAECVSGLCCINCRVARAGVECRPRAHPECDIPEFCNGSSSACDPDVTIINGHLCKNDKFICYDGNCHDLDERCEKLFGKGSRNAPFHCYEEIQPQRDRFGNCGWQATHHRYAFCQWRDLICGRLICTYPSRIPFHKENAAVIYAFVRDSVCVTVDFKTAPTDNDPMMVQSGSQCDTGRICVEGSCVESRMLISESKTCSEKCNGHGVCNSKQACHCFDNFSPPDCLNAARVSPPRTSGKKGSIVDRIFRTEKKWWLLSLYIYLPVFILAIIIALKWNSLKRRFSREEDSISSKSSIEGSTHTNASRSRSGSGNQTDTSHSISESSTQAYPSRYYTYNAESL